MNIIFFDNQSHQSLLPLTYTRPAADLRVGTLKISEKWELQTDWAVVGYLTTNHLKGKYPINDKQHIFIAANLIPNANLIQEIVGLKEGEVLESYGECLAFKTTKPITQNEEMQAAIKAAVAVNSKSNSISIQNFIDIFKHNGEQIAADIESMRLEPITNFGQYNTLIGNDFFIHPTVKMEGVTLNSTGGPIYLAEGVEVMEGSVIRGPFAALEHATIKMSAKIYGDTTVGPHCKVGGEVSNSVFYGYSNKGHDGFVGNSVIGEWCNLGADTNTSNLKNNYSHVSVWDYVSKTFENSGETFCGLIMGDHSKTAINTMLNTGTVVGVSANVFGGGFPPKFIPSFSWGGADGFETFKLEKAKVVAQRMMERRDLTLTPVESEILDAVFEADKIYRD